MLVIHGLTALDREQFMVIGTDSLVGVALQVTNEIFQIKDLGAATYARKT